MKDVDSFLWIGKARQAFGVSGKGLAVATLDTGLNAAHVDFAGRVLPGRNFTDDGGGDPHNTTDGNGNGTSVGGIIAASGDHRGVAPEARIAPLKVLRNNGSGNFDWLDQALGWVLENHAENDISTVYLALGDSGNYTSDDSFAKRSLAKKIGALRQARVTVVAPAGNDYSRGNGQQGMSYPAILRDTISVGAVYTAEAGPFTYVGAAKAFSTPRRSDRTLLPTAAPNGQPGQPHDDLCAGRSHRLGGHQRAPCPSRSNRAPPWQGR